MNRFTIFIDKILASLCIILSISLVCCVVWQVLSRYVFSSPSTYTDEIARFLFIWVGLLGAAYALGQKKHLSIDLLATYLEKSVIKQNTLNLFINLISICFASIIMCYGGFHLVFDTLASGQISPVLGIKMGFIYLAIPLSGVFMLIYLIRDLILNLKNIFPLKY